MIYGVCVICSFAQSESYFKFILIFFIVITYCYTQLRQKKSTKTLHKISTFTFNSVLFILNYSVLVLVFISDPHSCMD